MARPVAGFRVRVSGSGLDGLGLAQALRRAGVNDWGRTHRRAHGRTRRGRRRDAMPMTARSRRPRLRPRTSFAALPGAALLTAAGAPPAARREVPALAACPVALVRWLEGDGARELSEIIVVTLDALRPVAAPRACGGR